MLGFNESLTFVQSPYIQNLVTVESCTKFVESTLFWNKVFMGLLVIMLIYTLYVTHREFIKKKLSEV